ncbi:hypothetical protein [uncultured Hydrogenophaga sp.]|uniref:hypothetical protein n=1 Tax=uncultured Hydrogenophaga sp. TaxID=199683 RepID=UPI00258A4A11|nr:hypothetical protein [uncultured Hydrogenophaga sp.]
MLYFKHPISGEVFAYDTEDDRERFGDELLVRMIEAEIAEHFAPASLVPQVVTMRQARLALLDAGLLAQVDAAIEALPGPQKQAARIEWEYSQEVRRDRPFVQTLGAAMGLSDEQLDALFTTAAGL